MMPAEGATQGEWLWRAPAVSADRAAAARTGLALMKQYAPRHGGGGGRKLLTYFTAHDTDPCALEPATQFSRWNERRCLRLTVRRETHIPGSRTPPGVAEVLRYLATAPELMLGSGWNVREEHEFIMCLTRFNCAHSCHYSPCR